MFNGLERNGFQYLLIIEILVIFGQFADGLGMSASRKDFENLCKSMPKVELHAHLNGSITEETLAKFVKGAGVGDSFLKVFRGVAGERTLSECFEIFKKIHDVIRTPAILYQCTMEVIKDFAADNVVYLELRTTPKQVHEITSKEEYLQQVIQAIIDSKITVPTITVKLLISIDRKMGRDHGLENVELAKTTTQKFPGLIVGIDLSGDPTKGATDWILELLHLARSYGFRTSCHLPEVINLTETKTILEFKPERVGHALYVHPSLGGTEELWTMLKNGNIPVESCITSNLISGVTQSLEKHYVTLLHAENMPFITCTDDSGVFNTTLSKEYIKFLEIVPVSPNDLMELSLKAVDYTFVTMSEQEKLKEIIKKWWMENDFL